MLIKKRNEIPSSEITDYKLYINRRNFLRGAVLVASTVATGTLYRALNSPPLQKQSAPKLVGVVKPSTDALAKGFIVDEKLTSFENITNYNNFYEFSR